MPFGSIYLSGWKVTIGSIYLSGWKCPSGSIYPSGWKYPSGPFTLQFPFTLRFGKYPSGPFTLGDGSTHRIHLPFGMEVLVESIDPSISIYPSVWKVSVKSIYHSGWKYLLDPFSLRVSFTLRDGSACRVHLPLGSVYPSGSIYPSGWKCLLGSIYPSGWKYSLGPFTLQVGKYLLGPFTLRVGK